MEQYSSPRGFIVASVLISNALAAVFKPQARHFSGQYTNSSIDYPSTTPCSTTESSSTTTPCTTPETISSTTPCSTSQSSSMVRPSTSCSSYEEIMTINFDWNVTETITYYSATVVPMLTPVSNGSTITNYVTIQPSSPPPKVKSSAVISGFTCYAPTHCQFTPTPTGPKECVVTVSPTPEAIGVQSLFEGVYTAPPSFSQPSLSEPESSNSIPASTTTTALPTKPPPEKQGGGSLLDNVPSAVAPPQDKPTNPASATQNAEPPAGGDVGIGRPAGPPVSATQPSQNPPPGQSPSAPGGNAQAPPSSAPAPAQTPAVGSSAPAPAQTPAAGSSAPAGPSVSPAAGGTTTTAPGATTAEGGPQSSATSAEVFTGGIGRNFEPDGLASGVIMVVIVGVVQVLVE